MRKLKTIVQGLILLAASLAVLFAVPLLAVPALWQLSPLLTPLALLLSPLLPMLAVAGAKWDASPSTDQHGQGLTNRGDLPGWARWMQTIDDRLPGGTYEPTVAKLLERIGRYWTSVYWIGLRNRAHGLRPVFGKESTQGAYFTWFEEDDQGRIYGVREDGTWYWSRKLGPLRVVAGHRIYKTQVNSGLAEYIAIPTATIKRA